MIKEEIEKAGRDEKNRNDINVIRTEIRSLKEKCQELEQNNSEEVKGELKFSPYGSFFENPALDYLCRNANQILLTTLFNESCSNICIVPR